MIKAVLFDMDATLLDINLTAFMARYAADVSRILSQIFGKPRALFVGAMAKGYLAMSNSNRADGLVNYELFMREMERVSGCHVADPAVLDAVQYYEREILPKRGAGIVDAHPMAGGLETLARVEELGLSYALATNPSFSEDCIRVRMDWAGIADVPFARVSHMGNSTRLKPKARYYEEFAAAIGLSPEECLMVGNDAKRDFPKPDIGMRTIYVGHARPSRAIWSGRMSELANALPAIVDRANLG